VCVIGNTIFFVSQVKPVSSLIYKLLAIIHARALTTPVDFDVIKNRVHLAPIVERYSPTNQWSNLAVNENHKNLRAITIDKNLITNSANP